MEQTEQFVIGTVTEEKRMMSKYGPLTYLYISHVSNSMGWDPQDILYIKVVAWRDQAANCEKLRLRKRQFVKVVFDKYDNDDAPFRGHQIKKIKARSIKKLSSEEIDALVMDRWWGGV
ncbi:hypothetical protein GFC29_3846 (plasmid) [Anoxybacillus sp. B7M1]|uniref:hypothetical protein n=1 Tax=Anoxybacillus sp. B7M1 TaxID=1490057 RepID=UPI0005CCADD1|nr:hypothetical protein [Anoxybacillus sp. B7M1]ANB66138.1 hypothetical protein GFC29_3846 [Anoxybacillus sp. B7M1]